MLNALRKEDHISHFSLSEAITTVQDLGVPTAYFRLCPHQLGLHHVVQKELPKGMHLAYDGLVVHVD